jgi:hypothetical protein
MERIRVDLKAREQLRHENRENPMAALAQHSGTPIQELARAVFATHVFSRFKSEGRQVGGAEREELVAAALAPDALDPRLVPSNLPKAENVRMVRAWNGFGLVDVGFGSEPLGQSGFSMLFERRGSRWIFLCVVSSWIS